MRMKHYVAATLTLLALRSAGAHPYDFSEADALLNGQLANLSGHVAVIVRQDGVELYRFQAGDIGYDTKTRMASFTKTISAGVILALHDEGLLSPDERLGNTLAIFETNGIGDPTVLDCWAMRHGIDSTVPYEHSPLYTLSQSVALLGHNGYLVHSPAGTQLGYDGAGMQAVGRIAELRTGQAWEQIARTRILDRCGMATTDYGQFSPNPSVPGGLRSTAEESINYAQMIIDRGWYAGQRVLSDAALDRMFTNGTRGLPVFYSPFPATHPLYPYNTDPDYAFGAWVLAENPATQHVEELVGAGAWGSYIWIDRRRGLTAVLITDVPPGSSASMPAALGLFDISRRQVESHQAQSLQATPAGSEMALSWQTSIGAMATRVYGSWTPIRDVFDLRVAAFLVATTGSQVVVPAFEHYAVVSEFADLVNTALVHGGNTVHATVLGDLNCDGALDTGDIALFVTALADPASAGGCDLNRADLNRDWVVDGRDIAPFVQSLVGP